MPSLVAQLDRPAVAAPALVALGRVVSPDLGAPIEERLREYLAGNDAGSRHAATVALGLLGSRDAGLDLAELVACSPRGHELVGAARVPERMRAIAALALALGDHPDTIALLLETLDDLPDSAREIRSAILVALGRMPSARVTPVRDVLLEQLSDRRMDTRIRSVIPTALARHGDRSVVPGLAELMEHRGTDRTLRQSLVLALGELGTAADGLSLATLSETAVDDGDQATRQFAWIALAMVCGRPSDSADHKDRDAAVEQLARELVRPRRTQDQPFIALAAGIAGRQRPSARPILEAALLEVFDEVSDGDVRATAGLGLGLLGHSAVAAPLLDAMNASHDEGLRSHLALAVGLSGASAGLETLRALALDESSSPREKREAALALRLLGDAQVAPGLVDALVEATDSSTRSGLVQALGALRDVDALDPLVGLLASDVPAAIRATTCAAMGSLAAEDGLPWRAPLDIGANYVARVADLEVLLDH